MGSLIQHHDDANSGSISNCTDDQLMDIYVRREVEKHNVHQAVSRKEEDLSRENEEERSDNDNEDESENGSQQTRRLLTKSSG